MITFIKSYNFITIKKKLILLYILNVIDLVFTLLLLNTGLFMEMNLLMSKTVQNYGASFVLKVILPAVILFYLYLRIQKASQTQLKKANVIINIAVIIYALINVSHFVWLLLTPLFLQYVRLVLGS